MPHPVRPMREHSLDDPAVHPKADKLLPFNGGILMDELGSVNEVEGLGVDSPRR